MGWTNSQFHEFRIRDAGFGLVDQEGETLDRCAQDVAASGNRKIPAEIVQGYDFGDGWTHSIKVERTFPVIGLAEPMLLEATGRCIDPHQSAMPAHAATAGRLEWNFDHSRPLQPEYAFGLGRWAAAVERFACYGCQKAARVFNSLQNAELAPPSVNCGPIKSVPARKIRHHQLAGQRLGNNCFLQGACKFASPDTASQKLKPMNRHVASLLVSNVAIALTKTFARLHPTSSGTPTLTYSFSPNTSELCRVRDTSLLKKSRLT